MTLNRVVLKSISMLLIFSVFAFPAFAEEPAVTEQPSPAPTSAPKIDAMYNKTASEGLAMRYPGKAALSASTRDKIRENGSISRSGILDVSLSMLEEGNPFMTRYNIITGSSIAPLLEYGIPYFFGGRKMNYVLSHAPEYRTWIEWQDSKIYYRKDMRYFLGLDCRGFIEYVWKENDIEYYPINQNRKKDSPERKIIENAAPDTNALFDAMSLLEIGDVISIYHPGLHLMFYIGTLSDYGYTEADFPQDPSILSYPLVIHCGVNAAYADWFYYLKTIYPVYKRTSVPDGGVTVSVLGYSNDNVVKTIRQQKQDTSYVLLPDDSWLTVLSFNEIKSWDVYR